VGCLVFETGHRYLEAQECGPGRICLFLGEDY
jgi:hypothetical protein